MNVAAATAQLVDVVHILAAVTAATLDRAACWLQHALKTSKGFSFYASCREKPCDEDGQRRRLRIWMIIGRLILDYALTVSIHVEADARTRRGRYPRRSTRSRRRHRHCRGSRRISRGWDWGFQSLFMHDKETNRFMSHRIRWGAYLQVSQTGAAGK